MNRYLKKTNGSLFHSFRPMKTNNNRNHINKQSVYRSSSWEEDFTSMAKNFNSTLPRTTPAICEPMGILPVILIF